MRYLTLAVMLSVLFPLSLLHSQENSANDKPVLTFVQITDAHVFDDGWKQPVNTGYANVGDDWTALHWAIQKTNELAHNGNQINFVMYSGDFGLENVQYPKNTPVKNDCDKLDSIPQDLKQGLPVIPGAWAAKKMAQELNTLSVGKVYLVSGNNDLYDERVTDVPRFKCFVDDLKRELSKFSPVVDVEELKSSKAVPNNSFNLLGFNTASFKKTENYSGKCNSKREGCPEAEIAWAQSEVNKAPENRPTLLFTHVPDLVDPYLDKPAWTIDGNLRSKWQKLACDSHVLAIFAGHFHDSDQNLYGPPGGRRNLTVDGAQCVAEKTWVAPPLAIKNQGDKSPRARGVLLVKIFADKRINVQPYWYEEAASGCCAVPAKAEKSPQRVADLRSPYMWIAIGVVLVLALFVIFVAAIKSGVPKNSEGTASTSKTIIENATMPASDGTMSDERKFIENLVGQRFNFFIVFFSLIVGGVLSTKNQAIVEIILTVGALIGWMITYTLVVAHIKLERILLKLDRNHPYWIIQEEVGKTGRKWIGIWIPVFCSAILTMGMILSWCGFLPIGSE